MHKILFYNKFIICFYMFRALCAHHQEVKIVLYSICYHHTYRWPSRSQVGTGLILCIMLVNRLTPNDPYMGRTAPLTSKRCILYIYSTNIGTENFKDALYSPFFFSSKCSLFHNANLFGSCIIHISYTGCAKIEKNNSGTKRLITRIEFFGSHT